MMNTTSRLFLNTIARLFLSLIFVGSIPLIFSSCSSQSEPDRPQDEEEQIFPEKKCQRTVIIYSVAANNLISSLRKDSVEMLNAAPDISGLASSNRLLLYISTGKSSTLSELKISKSGKPVFHLLKNYDQVILSTDPARLSQVIKDVTYLRPAEKYGIVFESHGTGWIPDFYTHSRSASGSQVFPGGACFSFGDDKTHGGRDSIDIDVLADAIPEGMFDYIWFDACYMAGIETVYQFRKKCEKFVGYVTEIGTEGLPYDKVLPYIVRQEPSLTDAARIMFDSYMDLNLPVSVSVIDTREIDELAKATRPLVSYDHVPYASFFQKYSRGTTGPFYDLRQYVETSASNMNVDQLSIDRFHSSLDKVVLYKALSPHDFNGYKFDLELFGGLSCHIPGQTRNQERENYFLRLDWGKAVFAESADVN